VGAAGLRRWQVDGWHAEVVALIFLRCKPWYGTTLPTGGGGNLN
jgi:hypothetical protein